MKSDGAFDDTTGDEVPGAAGEPAAQPSASDKNAAPVLPLPALVAETCSAMLDAVAIIDRIQAKQDAWKVEFLDQARRIAETTSHGVITVGSTLTETQQHEMVRRSFVAEVAGVLRVPAVTAGQLIDDSAVLMSRLPLTLAALREGEISLRHARIIVDQVSTLDEECTHALEESALPYAKKLTVSKFRQKARILRERIDADSITERRVKSATDRRVEFVPAPDGMAWLNLYTTAPEATSLYAAIRTAAMSQQSKTETRTLSQLGADVCADALAAGLVGGGISTTTRGDSRDGPADAAARVPTTAFGSIKPTVLVTVPALTLLAARSTNRRKPCESTSSSAMAPAGGRGGNRQAKHCEIDHTEAWEHGGPTDCDNLSHLCPEHHRTKHETTWQARQLPGGIIQWISPDGRTYTTEPDVRLPLLPDLSVKRGAPPPTGPPPGRNELPPF